MFLEDGHRRGGTGGRSASFRTVMRGSFLKLLDRAASIRYSRLSRLCGCLKPVCVRAIQVPDTKIETAPAQGAIYAPRRRRVAQQRDELAAPHSITSSARARS